MTVPGKRCSTFLWGDGDGMMGLISQLKQIFRTMMRTPVFNLLAICSFGIAITLNGLIWSFRCGSIQTITVPEPKSLITLTKGLSPVTLSEDEISNRASGDFVFQDVAGYAPCDLGLKQGDLVYRVPAFLISKTYFNSLKIKPLIGSLPGVNGPSTSTGVVVSFEFWQRQLASAPDVIGKSLVVNGQQVPISAVLPKDFRGPLSVLGPNLFLPTACGIVKSKGADLMVLARLRDGMGLSQAKEHLRALSPQLFPVNAGERPWIVSARVASSLPPGSDFAFSALLWFIQGLFLAVLGIAMANVGSFLLVKAMDRRGEFAMRLSLGASRKSLVLPLLLESLILAIMGALFGLFCLKYVVEFMKTLPVPKGFPFQIHFADPFDGQVLVFMAMITIMCGLITGGIAARHASRLDILTVMKQGTDSRDVSRIQKMLISSQIASVTVLLVIAGVFLLQLHKLFSLDSPLKYTNVLLFEFEPTLTGMDDARANQWQYLALDRLNHLPGTVAAATTKLTVDGDLMSNEKDWLRCRVRGQRQNQAYSSLAASISPDYLRTFGIPLRAGRNFNPGDSRGGPEVAMVSEAFAARAWPGQAAIGQELALEAITPGTNSLAPKTVCQVVGVVDNHGLKSDAARPANWVYRPLAQQPSRDVTFVVQNVNGSFVDRATLLNALRSLDSTLPVTNLRTFEEHSEISQYGLRLGTIVCGAAGLLALLLAGSGLYALINYQVHRRRKEIGLRLALGAHRSQILGSVLMMGQKSVLMGLAIGATISVIAVYALGYITQMLLGFILILVCICLLQVLTALLASLVPAMFASKTQPSELLREQG